MYVCNPTDFVIVETQEIPTERGVRQACIVYFESIKQKRTYSNIRYSGDIIPLTETTEKLQSMTDKTN